jgi:5-methylcytosine-specific restriction endonuclease McrA
MDGERKRIYDRSDIRKAASRQYDAIHKSQRWIHRQKYLSSAKGRSRTGFLSLCSSAEIREIQVLITFENYCEIIRPYTCEYCGEKLSPTGGGIDRRDNEPWYAKENCVPCCSDCNKCKGILTYEQFREKILKIVSRFK